MTTDGGLAIVAAAGAGPMTVHPVCLVEEAALTDLERLVTFSVALARKTERRRLDRGTVALGLRALLEKHVPGFVLVAKDKSGAIIGQTIVGGREWSEWSNGEYWVITSFCYLPGHDPLVIAGALLDAIVARARSSSRPVVSIRTNVRATNSPMHKLFPSIGLFFNNYMVFEMPLGKSGGHHPAPERTVAMAG